MTAVLTIAGSDPSGGAGVQSDLRVLAALGVTGFSAITALTVQNSRGVQSVHPVAAHVVYDQIRAILTDCPVQSVKIGMLGSVEQVDAAAAALNQFQPPCIILDPVLASTGGVPLLDDMGIEALRSKLPGIAYLITPNIEELGRLTGMPVQSERNRSDAARKLLGLGAHNVLIKGGHLAHAPIDVLVSASEEQRTYRAERVQTSHTHGTGCFLSAAIAACLAKGQSLDESIRLAKNFLTTALKSPVIAGEGRGYPDPVAAVRELAHEEARKVGRLENARRAAWLRDSLYVVTDSELRPDRSHEAITEQALAGGAKVVQLRDKRLSTSEMAALAKRLKRLTGQAGAILIVNDRVDIAAAADADGVHLGPDDMNPLDARRVLGPEKLIGVSVASIEEAEPFQHVVDYFGVGAIFGSSTKKDAGDAIGLDRLQSVCKHFPEMPVVAIGGINADNIADVAKAGADSAAVVSAVINAHDMRLATEHLLARYLSGRQSR